MAAPAWNPTASTAYEEVGASSYEAPETFYPGERIGPPVTSYNSKAKRRAALLISAMLLGGWALLGDRASLSTAITDSIGWASAWLDRRSPAPAPPTTGVLKNPVTAVGADPQPTTQPDETPSLQASTSSGSGFAVPAPAAAPAALTTAALPPAVPTPEIPPQPERLRPLDPTDPLQARAAAAGLHPDLSRVVLAKLSAVDYRNAGLAITTAITETPDSEVYVWPRQSKPELAHFTVRFVPGAPPDCRRYVVTVTKDGWLSTALPMEKCGAPINPKRRS